MDSDHNLVRTRFDLFLAYCLISMETTFPAQLCLSDDRLLEFQSEVMKESDILLIQPQKRRLKRQGSHLREQFS